MLDSNQINHIGSGAWVYKCSLESNDAEPRPAGLSTTLSFKCKTLMSHPFCGRWPTWSYLQAQVQTDQNKLRLMLLRAKLHCCNNHTIYTVIRANLDHHFIWYVPYILASFRLLNRSVNFETVAAIQKYNCHCVIFKHDRKVYQLIATEITSSVIEENNVAYCVWTDTLFRKIISPKNNWEGEKKMVQLVDNTNHYKKKLRKNHYCSQLIHFSCYDSPSK